MLRRSSASLLLLFATAVPALAQVETPAQIRRDFVVHPMHGGVPLDSETMWQLVRFTPGTADCSDGAPVVTNIEVPFDWSVRARGDATADAVRLRFRIDADGRPLGVTRVAPARSASPQPPGIDLADIVPAFTAWRFAAGAPHAQCEIAFLPTMTAFDTAPGGFVARYLVGPHRQLPEDRQLAQRLFGEESSCFGTFVEPRVRVYPPFRALGEEPGGWSYVMLAYDTDSRGVPTHVRVLESDAPQRMQDASVAAMRRSRFEARAVTGCTYPFHFRGGMPMKAPERPDKQAFRTPEARCEEEDEEWASRPPLRLPDAFVARGIEGWALLRYDMTEAGEPENVAVVASEPAAAFGEQALAILRSARHGAGEAKTGCLKYVVFRVPVGSVPTGGQ